MGSILSLYERLGTRRAMTIVIWLMALVLVGIFLPNWLPVGIALTALGVAVMSGQVGLILVIVWIAIQNTLIPIFYASYGGPSNIWLIVLAASEVTAVALVVRRVPQLARAWPEFRWLYVSSLVYVLGTLTIFFSHRSAGLFSALYNERMLLIPVLFFALGFLFSEERHNSQLFRAISVLTVAGAIFGLVDALLLGQNFWLTLHMGRYWTNIKHLPSGEIFKGLPGNFYENYGGSLLRRAVSFYGDPLAAGYSMSIGFGVMLYMFDKAKTNKWLWVVACMLVLAGIATTYTRAAYIMAAVELVFFYAYRRRQRRPISMLVVIPVLVIFLGIAGKVIISTLTLQNGSAEIHLHAFTKVPVMLMHPLGFGVGASGGPEGTYFQILWQYGLIVTALFIWWLVASLSVVLGSERSMLYMAMGIYVALLISGLFSEEMLTDTAAGLGWIILGVVAATGMRTKLKGFS